MDDLISRQAAIEAIDDIESEVADGFGFQYEKWRKYFCELLAAQPEQRWIPCSERLPSKDGKYIVTEKRYAVDDRNHDGKHTVIVEEVNWWGKWERAKFYEVTAWMPLPEPYRGNM